MKTLILALFLSLGFTAFAAGTIDIVGKLNAFSPKEIEVSDGRNVYTIDRKKLSPKQEVLLKGKTPGFDLHLQLPFDAITKVKKLAPTE